MSRATLSSEFIQRSNGLETGPKAENIAVIFDKMHIFEAKKILLFFPGLRFKRRLRVL